MINAKYLINWITKIMINKKLKLNKNQINYIFMINFN